MTMTYAKISGTGSYLPEKVLTNYDIEKLVDTTHQWIVERTGIQQRHIAATHETALTMALEASRAALAAAGLTPDAIGMIIVATTTPEKTFPSTACLLQEKLGIAGCPAFDLNGTACAGFIYGLSIADMYIRQGVIRHALVIGSELASRVVDWTDRGTCILFGDGAGAMVVSAHDQPGIYSTHLHADGTYHDTLYLDGVIGKPYALDKALYLQMKGNQLFKLAVTRLEQLFDETLAFNHMDKAAVTWLVPHQANIRIIEAMARKLSLPMSRVALTLDTQANTSSASIPLALDKLIREDKVKPGDILLLEAFGGGLAWGSALVRY